MRKSFALSALLAVAIAKSDTEPKKKDAHFSDRANYDHDIDVMQWYL